MRRILAVLLCCVLLALPVYADNAASEVTVSASVAKNGSCQITANATLRLEQPVDDLIFPLGSNVSAVTLNGANASLTQSGGITCINLSSLSGLTGTFPITVHYTVDSVLKTDDDGNQFVSVPLLTGFKYPVERAEFSVTMPDVFDAVPSFSSGYHDQDIERNITSTVNGAVISGSVNAPLKDSETLHLQLQPPEGMFIKTRSVGGSALLFQTAMGVSALLALVYWLLTMGCLPLLPVHRSTPPEGICAGNARSYLVHKGADLTMMVLHWAQLGYLVIHLDEQGRVFLYRKMEMGNERSVFEQRVFKSLFSKAEMVDASSFRFAKQCEKAAALSRRYSAGYLPKSGNPTIFRGLSCFVGLFAGLAMADAIVTSTLWRVIFLLLLGGICVWCSWHIQSGMSSLHLRDRAELYACGICCGIVLLVGLLCGCLNYALILILWSLFAGLAAAYGGKRSENGKRIYQDLLGLRRHMKKVSKAELIRILRTNPYYYYELAPFAIAMGVDKQLAARFDNLHIPNCSWLLSGIGPVNTAGEFYPILRDTVKSMTCEQRRPLWEKLLRLR